MKYMAMIWTEWKDEQSFDAEEAVRYRDFAAEAARAGVLAGGDALHDPSAATTVRVREERDLLTDGPFAETKEQISGYFLFDCPDLDHAIAWARRIPGARHGAVEVRPILDMDDMMR
jgi:hypothetical protein